jgi:hypothetical protein
MDTQAPTIRQGTTPGTQSGWSSTSSVTSPTGLTRECHVARLHLDVLGVDGAANGIAQDEDVLRGRLALHQGGDVEKGGGEGQREGGVMYGQNRGEYLAGSCQLQTPPPAAPTNLHVW